MTTEVISCNSVNNDNIKPNLVNRINHNALYNLNLNDLAKLALFRCGSVKEFGRRLGMSKGRASQILTGFHVPKDPKRVKEIAKVLSIDAVILMQLFEKTRRLKDDNNCD